MTICPETRAFVAILCALGAAACGGNIRVVQISKTGGVVALQGNQLKARQAAHEYMTRRCANGYDILEEGEAVVGQSTYGRVYGGSTYVGTSPYGVGRYSSGTGTFIGNTSDVREWRVVYQCNGQAPGVAPLPPPEQTTHPTIRGEADIQTLVVRFLARGPDAPRMIPGERMLSRKIQNWIPYQCP